VAGYVPSYFPAASNPADAQFVSVRTSEELAGIDVTMVRGRTARVAGRILEPGGAPTTAGSVTLRPRQRSSVVGVSVGARLSNDGFEFLNVPAGDYVIQVNRGRSNSWTEAPFGALPIVVNGADVTGLVLQLSAGSTVTGSIRFDTLDRSRLPPPSSIELSALSADIDFSPSRNVAAADIRPDWSFRMAGLNGPRRLQLQRVPAAWMLKEVLVNGIDVTDRPISFGVREASLTGVEVVLTDRVNELSGTVADERTGPAAGSKVIVFSTDRARWYPSSRFLRTAVAGADGRFVVQGLPAGGYYVAAVLRLPQDGDGAWQDPAFLDALSRSASVATITEGQQRAINVPLTTR